MYFHMHLADAETVLFLCELYIMCCESLYSMYFSCSLRGCIIELRLKNVLYRPFKPAASAVQVFVQALLCKVSLCHLLEDDWTFSSI